MSVLQEGSKSAASISGVFRTGGVFANGELPLGTSRHITRKLALPKLKPKCYMQQTSSSLIFCNVQIPNASLQ